MESKPKYSIEQVHAPKQGRRSGKSVDVCMAALQSVMVTENETICIVVPYLNRIRNLEPELFNICRYHFKEQLVLLQQGVYQIKGYSSRIRICNYEQWENREAFLTRIQPLHDD